MKPDMFQTCTSHIVSTSTYITKCKSYLYEYNVDHQSWGSFYFVSQYEYSDTILRVIVYHILTAY